MLAVGYYVFYNVLAMKVVFMGTPDYVVPVLNSIQGEVDLVGVFTAPDRAKGRHGTLLSGPVKEVALSKNIDVFQPTTLRDHAEQANFRQLSPDLVIVAAYGKIIPKNFFLSGLAN